MKLSAWQMLAALAIIFAAIIVAHVFAPGAFAIVVSLATAAFAALGLGLRREEPAAPQLKDPPSLKVIDGGGE